MSGTPPAAGEKKESQVLSVLISRPGSAFLEIGIGRTPKTARLRALQEYGIRYVGVDFASVCAEHDARLRDAGLGGLIDDGRIQFRGNARGTYNYTLLKLLRAGSSFDIIYLDGHHTLQVDLPAAILASAMLKRDGLLVVDDLHWSLSKLARLMHDSFETWLFYKDAYDLEQYEPEEIRDKGMSAIVHEILIPHLGFEPDSSFTTSGWIVLRRKAGWNGGRDTD